jgi:hypothetical protein
MHKWLSRSFALPALFSTLIPKEPLILKVTSADYDRL